jgi:trans-aconitate methyltransferase
MSVLVFIILLIIIVILGSFLVTLFILMIDSLLRGHDLPTSKRATKSVFEIISQQSNARNFYDLGCAHGIFSLRIKRRFPTIRVFAIDNDSLRIFFARMRAFLFRTKIDFIRSNIFDVDLSDADIVYTYLWYDLMPPLESKLEKELKSGAIVITNTSKLPNWKPIRTVITYPRTSPTPDFETLFIYQKM